jgi:hypothetical protein
MARLENNMAGKVENAGTLIAYLICCTLMIAVKRRTEKPDFL